MSKLAQRNQSAFNVGKHLGQSIFKDMGEMDSSLFNTMFNNLYKGAKRFKQIAFKAAKIGYLNARDKAEEVAKSKTLIDKLTGGDNA